MRLVRFLFLFPCHLFFPRGPSLEIQQWSLLAFTTYPNVPLSLPNFSMTLPFLWSLKYTSPWYPWYLRSYLALIFSIFYYFFWFFYYYFYYYLFYYLFFSAYLQCCHIRSSRFHHAVPWFPPMILSHSLYDMRFCGGLRISFCSFLDTIGSEGVGRSVLYVIPW